MAGDGEVGFDEDASGPVLFGTRRAGQRGRDRRRLDARRPQHGACVEPGRPAVMALYRQAVRADVGDPGAQVELHSEPPQGSGGTVGQPGAERAQHRVGPLEEQHPGLGGIDLPELPIERVTGDLPDLSREFDTGRPAAHESEGEPLLPFPVVHCRFGHLERPVDPSADLERVVQGLHAGGVRGELVVPEVGLTHAHRDDEVVVRQHDVSAPGPPGVDQPGVGIHVGGFGKHAAHVVVASQDPAERLCDLPLGQDPGGTLVQQRLEEVVGAAVDHGHRDR